MGASRKDVPGQGGGGQPKKNKRGQGRGVQAKGTSFSQKETNALDIMPVFNKNDH